MSSKNRFVITTEGQVKMVLSILLLLNALITTIEVNNICIFLAMLFSSIGDYSIASSRGAIGPTEEKNKTDFNVGVAAFAVAHVLYTFAMGMKVPFEGTFVLKLAIAIVFVAACTAFLLGILDSKNATIPYALCLIATAFISFHFGIVTGIGYVLFVASDLILAIFEDKSPKWQYAIWGTYVPAQALIITSFLLAK